MKNLYHFLCKYFQKFPIRLSILLLFLFFVYPQNIYTQTLTAEQIYKKVTGAVVVILAYDLNNELSSQGSGVVINDKGYVVTNYHVLEGNDRLEIMHNKEIVPFVDIIGIDVEKDVLILKIEAKKFPAIKIGDSKKLNIGQRVYAIGSPLEFENTISEGIISGLRSYEESGKNFIQITASISSGSSGGAVVNDKGELIGISTLTAKEGQNLNFAVPIDEILSVEIGSYLNNDVYKNFELFTKGDVEYNNGNYREAIKYYTSFMEKYPNYSIAFNNRGNAKNKLKDFCGAIQDYKKAIEINPKDEIAYNNLGQTKFDLKEYEDAIKAFNIATEINSDYAAAYYNRGVVKGILSDYKGAIQDYDLAIKNNPDDVSAYINRGAAKDNLKDYRGAIKDYKKAIKISPNNEIVYNNLGLTNFHLKEFEDAIKTFSKAIEINPNFADAYLNRGTAKAELKEYRSAIQDFSKVIDINSNDVDGYYNRGLAKFKLGDKYGACSDWYKVRELEDDSAYDLIKKFCD